MLRNHIELADRALQILRSSPLGERLPGRLATWVDVPARLGQLWVPEDRQGKPVGFLTWAFFGAKRSHEMHYRDPLALHASEWNEGLDLWVVHFVVCNRDAILEARWKIRDLVCAYGRLSYVRARAGFRRVVTLNRWRDCSEGRAVSRAASDVHSAPQTELTLAGLVPHLYEPFSARRLRAPTILWVNKRYFVQNGVDIESEAEIDAVKAWLIDEFAYSVPTASEPKECYGTIERTLYADRYGGPAGAAHGGSGRCGASGGFNAKGIGRTPLCNQGVDWYHSHGCMWLEEAIRETIYSELAYAEFPHRAVPVVAIIDTGNCSYWDDGSIGERRAIIVRPNCFRLAHLQRSIYFGAAGRTDSSQYVDAQRTREAIEAFCTLSEQQNNALVIVKGLADSLTRVAEQIGFGWAHRLFHGAYLSSNISVNGELVDFGSFRALPDWRRASTVEFASGFGDDLQVVDPTIDSLSFYFPRYASPALRIPDNASLHQMVRRVAMARFDAELCSLVAPIQDIECGLADEIVNALRQLFFEQQAVVVDYLKGEQKRSRGWLFSCLRQSTSATDSAALSAVCGAICKLSVEGERSKLIASVVAPVVSSILRWSQPRRLMYRENLLRLIARFLANGSYRQEAFAGRLEALLTALLSRERRVWSLMNARDILVGQSTDCLSYALYCQSGDGKARYLRMQGIVRDQRVLCFGATCSLRNLLATQEIVSLTNGEVVFDINHEWRSLSVGPVVQVAGRDVRIPSPATIYVSDAT
jgi:hypothetical protein